MSIKFCTLSSGRMTRILSLYSPFQTSLTCLSMTITTITAEMQTGRHIYICIVAAGAKLLCKNKLRRSDRGAKLPTGQLASKYSNPCFCPQPWPADNRIIRPRTTLHSPRPARPSIICKNLNKYRLRLNHVSSSFVWFNGTFRGPDTLKYYICNHWQVMTHWVIKTYAFYWHK